MKTKQTNEKDKKGVETKRIRLNNKQTWQQTCKNKLLCTNYYAMSRETAAIS